MAYTGMGRDQQEQDTLACIEITQDSEPSLPRYGRVFQALGMRWHIENTLWGFASFCRRAERFLGDEFGQGAFVRRHADWLSSDGMTDWSADLEKAKELQSPISYELCVAVEAALVGGAGKMLGQVKRVVASMVPISAA